MMEVVSSPEMLVNIYQSTHCNIPSSNMSQHLKTEFLPQWKHNTSPLQRSVG
jgi:hypothetical protein